MDLWAISYVVLWLLVIAEAVVLLVLLRAFGSMYLGSRDAIERDGLRLGTRAPDFTATAIDGTSVPLASLLDRWAVLVFAEPGCPICEEMGPQLTRLARELADRARVVLLVRRSAELMRASPLASFSNVAALAIGAHGTADEYRVRVSPYVHVLDPEGVVRGKGLVNERKHVEHILYQAGFRDPVVNSHAPEEAAARA